jgi:hypothetical protein
VSADVHQEDELFLASRVRLEGKNYPAIVFNPAGPQAAQTAAQFMGFQDRI